MRLAGYVLLELVTGVSLAAGLAGGVYYGSRAVSSLATLAYASEAPVLEPRHHAPPPLEHPLVPRALQATAASYFLGIKDEILVQPLLDRVVTRVKYNRGGSSISLRLDFEGGWRAAFKPDQINQQTVPRKEIAAYRVSRLLGLEAVAPAVARRFTMQEILDKIDDGSRDMVGRIQTETTVDEEGTIVGELSWWIPIIVDAKLENVTIDSPEGMTAWHKYLTVGAPEPYSGRALLPQISNMVVFDYLINNSDRWSGSNAKASPDGKTLFFMDNTLAFGPVPEGSPKVRTVLEKVQKYSRQLVRRVRTLGEPDLRAAMTSDTGPYERLLSENEIAAVLYRREAYLNYVDGLVEQFGEAEVLCYP